MTESSGPQRLRLRDFEVVVLSCGNQHQKLREDELLSKITQIPQVQARSGWIGGLYKSEIPIVRGGVESHPELALPILYKIYRYFETLPEAQWPIGKNGLPKEPRKSSLLPLKHGFTISHMKMCNLSLRGLLVRSGVSGLPSQDKWIKEGHAKSWWRKLFHISKYEKGTRKFAGEIEIDGKAVSVTLRCPAPDKVNPLTNKVKPKKQLLAEEKLKRILPEAVSVSSNTIWGLDPGRSDLFCATNNKGDSIHCHTAEFREDAYFKKSNQKHTTWTRARDDISRAYADMPRKKTVLLDQLESYGQFALARVDDLLRFSIQNPYRQLRFKRFIFAQKKLAKLAKQFAQEPDVLVGFGDWSNQDSGIIKSCPSGPVLKVMKKQVSHKHVRRFDKETGSKEIRFAKVKIHIFLRLLHPSDILSAKRNKTIYQFPDVADGCGAWMKIQANSSSDQATTMLQPEQSFSNSAVRSNSLSPETVTSPQTANAEVSGAPHVDSRGSTTWAISLRSVIILLVLINIASVGVVTVWLGIDTNSKSISKSSDEASRSIQALGKARLKDASGTIVTALPYLEPNQISGTSGTNFNQYHFLVRRVRCEVINYLLPPETPTATTSGASIGMYPNSSSRSFLNHMTLAKDSIIGGPGQATSLYLTVFNNATCQQMCRTSNTQGRVYGYWWDETTLKVANPTPMINTTIPLGTENFVAVPKGSAVLSDIRVVFNLPIQIMYLSVYSPSGSFIATSSITFLLRDFCSLLDTVKASLTPNTLTYILTTKQQGQVVGISGLGNSTMQLQALFGGSKIKTIFEYPLEQYPTLNTSAALLYQYSGNNLSTTIEDASFEMDNFMFHVTTVQIYNFRYLVVVGAPPSDFVGDTALLAETLRRDGARSSLIVIIAAIVLALVMSGISVVSVWVFVSSPLLV
ncbi:hypothetical protein M427DRAFT_44955 [Gonapodya prolifera JEL478]|uniref:Uncharacterized protein n=1 Tax=Gonapodya prolifera (strain JEL478) TaxID=1344416 RepID=A0A139ACY0_GONPJ|nr:hypothetical protein M427DRAFT_44955 [Gonapodya prolifera JEL478]|eukprot:KXS14529.1 hypothetical protein M427DRAFT_44955 [Gonapodya prolifera JEL478]